MTMTNGRSSSVTTLIGLLTLFAFIATLVIVVMLSEVSIECITPKHANILERCDRTGRHWLSLSNINLLTMLLYGTALLGSGCLLGLCYVIHCGRRMNSFSLGGFLMHRLKSSVLDPMELATTLPVWGATIVFIVACVVEFGVGLSMWGLTSMVIINVISTNVIHLTVLAPLDLGGGDSSTPPARPMLSYQQQQQQQQPQTLVAEGDIGHSFNNDDGEEEIESLRPLMLSTRSHGSRLDWTIHPSHIFRLGLLSSLLLNAFFLGYDAAVVTLRVAYNDLDTQEKPTERTLLLLCSFATIWYRAFHVRFCFRKLLFPSCNVLAFATYPLAGERYPE